MKVNPGELFSQTNKQKILSGTYGEGAVDLGLGRGAHLRKHRQLALPCDGSK